MNDRRDILPDARISRTKTLHVAKRKAWGAEHDPKRIEALDPRSRMQEIVRSIKNRAPFFE